MVASNDPRTLSLEYIEAVGQKRFDQVAELLDPDLEFVMPGKTLRGRDAYLAALRRLAPILLQNNVRTTVVDGNDVCLVYDFITDTAVGPVPSVEWLTVGAGRIRTVRLVFHRERWPEVLAELGRRTAAAGAAS